MTVVKAEQGSRAAQVEQSRRIKRPPNDSAGHHKSPLKMTPTDKALKEQRHSVAEAVRPPQSQTTLNIMMFLGMMIGGMMERSAYPNPTSQGSENMLGLSLDGGGPTNRTTPARRYCDPPNVTILIIYDMYHDSEEQPQEGDYDFSQMEEMDFEAKLTTSQQDSQLRLQAFLMGYLASPILASCLAVRFGPGRVLGVSLLSAGVLGLLIPTQRLPVQIAIMSVHGLFLGCLLPCALLLAVNSTKESSREKYLAYLSGGRLGYGMLELIPNQLRLLTSCLLALTWFATWVLMVRTRRRQDRKHKDKVPWRKILTSRVVWMSAIAMFGTEFLNSTTMYTIRQYFDFVYNYANKYVFSLPQVLMVVVAFASAWVGTAMETVAIVSRTTSRRIFVYISHFLPAALLFMICFVGCGATAPTVLYSAAVMLEGAAFAGAYPSILDASTPFAPIVIAITCTCGAAARIFPVFLTTLVLDGMMPGSWRLVISINSLVGLMTAIFFMLRGSSRQPSWNYPDLPQQLKHPQKLTLEKCILRVHAIKETEKYMRTRASSTSDSPVARGRPFSQKRASLC